MAQAAAVLGGDYDAELVEALLGLEPAQALEGWIALEAAQLLTPERFRHDVVWEAVRASVPAAAADLLRRRARAETGRRAQATGGPSIGRGRDDRLQLTAAGRTRPRCNTPVGRGAVHARPSRTCRAHADGTDQVFY